jgi:polyferredoxin
MSFYRVLADAVVAAHFAYVAFVVVGMALILLGIVLHWSWVRNFWFRAIHLLMIAVVVAESVCGIVCPLTTWEDRLRETSGGATETGSFIGRWAHRLLFVNAPPWVLTSCYVAFGLAVLAAFILAPPRRPRFARKQTQ